MGWDNSPSVGSTIPWTKYSKPNSAPNPINGLRSLLLATLTVDAVFGGQCAVVSELSAKKRSPCTAIAKIRGDLGANRSPLMAGNAGKVYQDTG